MSMVDYFLGDKAAGGVKQAAHLPPSSVKVKIFHSPYAFVAHIGTIYIRSGTERHCWGSCDLTLCIRLCSTLNTVVGIIQSNSPARGPKLLYRQ
jgi:hypothetical protein